MNKRIRSLAAQDPEVAEALATLEVTAASGSYHEYMMKAEKKFLEDVAKELNKYKKNQTKVQVGRGHVWLEVEGEDLSDLSFEMTVSLVPKMDRLPYQVKVIFSVNHVMMGGSDHNISLAIGLATPKAVAEVLASTVNLKG